MASLAVGMIGTLSVIHFNQSAEFGCIDVVVQEHVCG